MSIKIQQIEVQGNNTKYSVNYNNQQNRTFIVPNDKKDEFVSKYPKAHAINQAITSGSLILVCGFSAIGGSKLVSKISKAPSKLAKFGAGIAAACAFGFAYLAGATLVLNNFDKKLLDKYNAKEITESKNQGGKIMQVQRVQNNNNYNTSFMAKNLTNKAAYERIKLLRRDLLSSIVNGKYDKFVKLRQEYVENRAKYPLEANSLRPLKNVLREDMDIKSAAKGLINMLKFAVKDLFRAHNAK